MKKAIALLATLAVMTSGLFAQVTATGDFELDTTTILYDGEVYTADSWENKSNDKKNDFSLKVGAKTDYTELRAELKAELKYGNKLKGQDVDGVNDGVEIELDESELGYDVNNDGDTDDVITYEGEADTDDTAGLKIDKWYIKQNITGALGIEGPVTVKLTGGKVDIVPKELNKGFVELDEIGMYSGTDIGWLAEIDVDAVANFRLGYVPVYDSTVDEDFAAEENDPAWLIGVHKDFGVAAVALSYVTNQDLKNTGEDRDPSTALQLDVNSKPVDGLEVALTLIQDTRTGKNTSDYGNEADFDLMVAAEYEMDALTVLGQATFVEMTGANDTDMWLAYAEASVDYDVTEELTANVSFMKAVEGADYDSALKIEEYGSKDNPMSLSVSGAYDVTDYAEASLGLSIADLEADELKDEMSIKLGLEAEVDGAEYNLGVGISLAEKNPIFLSANVVYEW